jgi:hypothetical protein
MDFVTGLPDHGDQKYDAIWVIVDRLTKDRHFIPCHTTVDAESLADLFIQHVFRVDGLLRTPTYHRISSWPSIRRRHVRTTVQPPRYRSTAFHAQTEIINVVTEQYLRAHVSYLQDDWAYWLSLAEFAANNQDS